MCTWCCFIRFWTLCELELLNSIKILNFFTGKYLCFVPNYIKREIKQSPCSHNSYTWNKKATGSMQMFIIQNHRSGMQRKCLGITRFKFCPEGWQLGWWEWGEMVTVSQQRYHLNGILIAVQKRERKCITQVFILDSTVASFWSLILFST